MLRVGLLGVFRISNTGVRAWSELGPAGRGLASYLFTFPDRPHRRERLADLFWPELNQERARAALNSAVWRVRRVLETVGTGDCGLRTIGSDVVLEKSEWLEIDARVLEEIANITIKEPTSLSSPGFMDRTTSALARYEGPFLDGVDGTWILEERERLHSLFVRTAMHVVRRLGAEAHYCAAIDLARFVLKYDPYREELVRYLLCLFLLDEQRATAIRHYDQWSASLKRELGIAPLPATQALIEDIRVIQCGGDVDALRERLFSKSGA
jgi:DNA-binding SARP family transcriptional activator